MKISEALLFLEISQHVECFSTSVEECWSLLIAATYVVRSKIAANWDNLQNSLIASYSDTSNFDN